MNVLRESLGVSGINHILRVHGQSILLERQAAKIFDEVGQRYLERLLPGFKEDSLEQATLSASQSGVGYKRARDVASPAHLGALNATKQRILGMIQDAATAGLVPKQPSAALLDASIEAATAVYLEAINGSEKPTGKFQSAQAADESWQQTVHGRNGPTGTNPTVSEIKQSCVASQDLDVTQNSPLPHTGKSRLSAPQLQAQLSRLTERG